MAFDGIPPQPQSGRMDNGVFGWIGLVIFVVALSWCGGLMLGAYVGSQQATYACVAVNTEGR